MSADETPTEEAAPTTAEEAPQATEPDVSPEADPKATEAPAAADSAPPTPDRPDDIGLSGGKVIVVPLGKIDGEDTTYMFRAALRIGPLADSIGQHGIQVPLMLRRKDGTYKYQIVSGFRRYNAALKAGLDQVPAVVRDLTDEEAFRASVLENSSRKTYSDIDRANVIKLYEDRGYSAADITKVLGLNQRQVRNIKALLKLPKVVQLAVDDPDQHFGTTHAITLRALASKHRGLKYEPWIKRVNEDSLSVTQLKRAVGKEYVADERPGFTSMFQEDGTDLDKGEVRFSPVKVSIGDLSADEKGAMKAELEKLLKALG